MEGRGWQLQRGESTNCNQAQQSLNLARGTGRGVGGAGMRELEPGGQGLEAGGKLWGLYIPPTSSLWLWAALGRALSLGKGACPQLRRPRRELMAEATCTSTGRVLRQELRVHLSDNR